MLRLATRADRAAMAALWREAFGDSAEAVDFFFRSFPRCLSYVAEVKGAVCAMVHALPQTLSPDLPAAYIYAVATDRAHRGQGLCRKLMAFAEEDLRLRGPGDFFGSRQSGLPVFRVANLSCDLQTLKAAQQASAHWIDTEGTAQTAEAEALRIRIATLFARADGTMN